MAQETVKNKNVSVTLSCKIFMISETCYRYTARLSDENSLIAQYLIDLTNQKKNWGFKLCFLYLRNVKGYKFNHKRVYRIYTESVIKTLENIIEYRGKPKAIRCDNGPEYISYKFTAWAVAQGIKLLYIQPGNPQQNAYVERYNRTVRYDWLNQYEFKTYVCLRILRW